MHADEQNPEHWPQRKLTDPFLPVPQSGGQEQSRQLPEQRDTWEAWVGPEYSGPDFLLL